MSHASWGRDRPLGARGQPGAFYYLHRARERLGQPGQPAEQSHADRHAPGVSPPAAFALDSYTCPGRKSLVNAVFTVSMNAFLELRGLSLFLVGSVVVLGY